MPPGVMMGGNQNSAKAQTKPAKSSIVPILAVNFIGTLGYSIVIPFLVFLVTRFGGNALIYGVMGATYSVFQLIGAPTLGRWSDVIGRRKVLLLSQTGTLLSWIIFFVALFLPVSHLFKVESPVFGEFSLTLPLIVLFLARALDGITGGNVSVANAYLADITEEERRNENFGKMAVSSNLGFILGPAFAGLLGATVWGEALPVLAALMISLFATFIIAFNLPESKPCLLRRDPEKVNVRKVFGQEHKPCFEMKGAERLKTKDVFRMRNIPYLMVLYFLIFLGFNLFYTAFPIHAVKSLNWSVAGMGTFFSVLSLMMVIVQGPVLSKVSKRCSDSFLVVVGSVILGTNFIMLMSRHIVLIYIAGGLFAIGNGVMWPSVLSVISRSAGDKFQGSVQGITSSFGSLASIIGLVVGGILYGILGGRVFLVSAVTIYVVFFLSFRLLSFGKRASEV